MNSLNEHFKNYIFKNQIKILNTKITLKFFKIFNQKMKNHHNNNL